MTRSMEAYLKESFRNTAFCPGCGHGILMGAVLRAVDHLQIPTADLLFVSGIGCAAWIPSPGFAADTLHTLHGRALAFATGAKLARPSLKVIVVSGDGDLSSIGGNHLIHSARRNLDVTVICANNQIYGMTGGQTASTTPVGTRTSTDPQGNPFPPFDLCKLVAVAGAQYAARYPVSRPGELIQSIVRAIETPGFTFVEALSPCPSQFGRRNGMNEVTQVYAAMDALCVDREAGDSHPSFEGCFVVGEFYP